MPVTEDAVRSGSSPSIAIAGVKASVPVTGTPSGRIREDLGLVALVVVERLRFPADGRSSPRLKLPPSAAIAERRPGRAS
jgi:hypothetical protein